MLIKLHLTDALGTEKIISLCVPLNSKKSVPRNHRNIFIQLKNISVYEVLDKIDNELTNILL